MKSLPILEPKINFHKDPNPDESLPFNETAGLTIVYVPDSDTSGYYHRPRTPHAEVGFAYEKLKRVPATLLEIGRVENFFLGPNPVLQEHHRCAKVLCEKTGQIKFFVSITTNHFQEKKDEWIGLVLCDLLGPVTHFGMWLVWIPFDKMRNVPRYKIHKPPYK